MEKLDTLTQLPTLGQELRTPPTRPFMVRACLRSDVGGSRIIVRKQLLLLLGINADGYPINSRIVTNAKIVHEMTEVIGCRSRHLITWLQIFRAPLHRRPNF